MDNQDFEPQKSFGCFVVRDKQTVHLRAPPKKITALRFQNLKQDQGKHIITKRTEVQHLQHSICAAALRQSEGPP